MRLRQGGIAGKVRLLGEGKSWIETEGRRLSGLEYRRREGGGKVRKKDAEGGNSNFWEG